MAAEKGRAFLLKLGDGADPESFTIIAGLRSTSLSLNNELVDITNKGSGGWRELLAGAGVRRISVTGAGVFTDSQAEQDMQSRALAASVDTYEVVFESGAKFAGSFLIAALDYAGEHNGERTYSVSLESAGAIAAVAT